MYESTINFTLDTICPWTYLAKKRLDEGVWIKFISSHSTEGLGLKSRAPHLVTKSLSFTFALMDTGTLRLVRATDAPSKVTFKIHYYPYQLYPDASQEGEDKYAWYKKSKYGDSEEKMQMYIKLMTAYGLSAGITYKFNGTMANSLPAHRIIQYFQTSKGPEVADKLVSALYRMYFEEEKHPSSKETLLAACREAGIEEKEAEGVIGDEERGLREVRGMVREQEANGVDSVPLVVIEGRRRDVTVAGANEVGDYVKALESIVKESS